MKNVITFLKMYYHVKSNKDFISVIFQDILATILFIGGSGLFLSIWRGFYYRIILNLKSPSLFGGGFKIINPGNFSAGRNIWFKDNVSILAGGKIKMGDNCVVCENASIWSHDKGVRIGSDTAIGKNSYICGTGGSIVIGNEVRIADHVRMYSFNHNFSDLKKPIAKQGYTREGIIIEDNVWIGSGAVILDGVYIKKNSVVGAGAVVTKNIPENVLVGGIPAKVIKKIKIK